MTLREPIDPARAARGCETLVAYASGFLTREDAIANLGLRDYAGLLVALGNAGLSPPRPPEAEIRAQALNFERVWRAA